MLSGKITQIKDVKLFCISSNIGALHEAVARRGRTQKNTTQKRNEKNKPYYKGFNLGDKVRAMGETGYITGFTNGGAYVKRWDDTYITIRR